MKQRGLVNKKDRTIVQSLRTIALRIGACLLVLSLTATLQGVSRSGAAAKNIQFA